MLLGEAPGEEEDGSGKPFVGSAGRVLDNVIHQAGFERSDFFISNSTKCRPPGNRTPLPAEQAACFTYLAEEIEAIQPKVILCLGGAALKTLTGKDKVASNRGHLVAPKPTVRIGDAKVLITYHPAATLHPRTQQEKDKIRESIAEDLKLAVRLAGGASPNKHKKALLVPVCDDYAGFTREQLKATLTRLAPAKVLACDLEWTALTDRKISWPWSKGAELYSIALTGRVNGELLSLSFGWPLPEGSFQDLQEFFQSHPLVFHNAPADLNWLQSVKLQVRLAGDSLMLGHLMDEEQRLALDQMAPIYTDVEPGWKIGPWSTRPRTIAAWKEVLGYNADDTYATLKLVEALHVRLEKLPEHERNAIKRMYYHLILPVIPTFVSMALAGTPVNHQKLVYELGQSRERLVRIMNTAAGIVRTTPHRAAELMGSPTQTLDYLKRAYGLEIDSSAKDDLVGFEAYPIVPLTQEYRWEQNKVQGTYLGKWDELLREQGDGRLHSVYRLTYSRTGRTSAELEKGGSLQLMPRDQEDRALRTRELVEAPSGYKIVAADQSQVELRIFAWIANERRMRQFFNDGEDLHYMTAAFMLALRSRKMSVAEFLPQRAEWIAKVSKDDRQKAKGANFGLIFMLAAEGLQAYAKANYKVDLTYEEAVDIHRGFFLLYPDAKAYHEYCANVIFPQGFTETPFGRFRRNLEDVKKAVNTPVQATASDLSLFAMYHIDQRFKRERWPVQLIGFVHDSVLSLARDDYVERVAMVIKEEMEHPDLRPLGVSEIPVPLKTDIQVGQTWGSAIDLSKYLANIDQKIA